MTTRYTKENLTAKLVKLLGEGVVVSSGLALPELCKMAAVEIFYNCDTDEDLGETSYLVRLALTDIRRNGQINFEY
jgi:hypothetical protein